MGLNTLAIAAQGIGNFSGTPIGLSGSITVVFSGRATLTLRRRIRVVV